jgi:hypothetical protein
MPGDAPIQAGRIYWVTFEHARICVRTVRPLAGMPGWWECESIDGRTPLILQSGDDWKPDTADPNAS